MKKHTFLIALFAFVISLPACSSQKWLAVDASVDTEQLLREKFPKLYSKVNAKEIVIDKVEQQLDKNGEMKYRVTYSHKDDDDDFNLLWQTIYMPMLLGD
ncbi:MAG: hypothetical protein IKT86_06005 [Bacteroidaceae bacterium]|nr:hypothetical protein [Bacteroidaceae bacterium]